MTVGGIVFLVIIHGIRLIPAVLRHFADRIFSRQKILEPIPAEVFLAVRGLHALFALIKRLVAVLVEENHPAGESLLTLAHLTIAIFIIPFVTMDVPFRYIPRDAVVGLGVFRSIDEIVVVVILNVLVAVKLGTHVIGIR